MGGMNFLSREGNSPHETRECGRHCGAKFGTFIDREMRLTVSNAIKLTNKFQKKEKSLDKGKKMCGKALKTRLIFRGRAHEIHS